MGAKALFTKVLSSFSWLCVACVLKMNVETAQKCILLTHAPPLSARTILLFILPGSMCYNASFLYTFVLVYSIMHVI